MENKELIIKALLCLKSHKDSNLKNALKNGRAQIANKRFNEICEIDKLIIQLQDGKADYSSFTSKA